MKHTARIEDWWLHTQEDGSQFLTGRIFSHVNQNQFKARWQATSRLLSINETTAETIHTYYTLGVKRLSAHMPKDE